MNWRQGAVRILLRSIVLGSPGLENTRTQLPWFTDTLPRPCTSSLGAYVAPQIGGRGQVVLSQKLA